MRRIFLGLALALVALPAAADPAADELMDVFAAPCLARFPDNAAVESYARQGNLAAMSADRLAHLLGTDPGEGWLRNTARGEYVLTIEMPPYHTCAVRKAEPKSLDAIPAFTRLIGAWAAKQPGTALTQQPTQNVGIDNIPSTAYLWRLDRGPGKEPEDFMAIVSNFPDGQTEVRLVRAIGNR